MNNKTFTRVNKVVKFESDLLCWDQCWRFVNTKTPTG